MSNKTKVLISSVIGNGLEFYDFSLFAAFSIKFSKLFADPSMTSAASILKILGVVGIGFFMRPVGALFFGYIGDRVGRKNALGLSIILMGIATLSIGCLPTYEHIGLMAFVFLVLIRSMQGFCLGGENNGSAIFFLEHLKERKGLAGALILTGGALGTLLAYGASSIVSLEGMPSYAWRIPFIAGFFVALLGLYIRRSLPEPEQSGAQSAQEGKRFLIAEVWTHHRRAFLCAIGIGGVNVALSSTTTTYLHVYAAQVVGFPLYSALFCSCLAITFFGLIFAPLMGHLSDRLSSYRVMHTGCLLIALMAFPLFYTLHMGTKISTLMGVTISAFLMGTFNGPTNAYLNQLFPPRVRYTGIAVGYAVGAACFGGMAPYYYEYLIRFTGHPLSPAIYLVLVSFLGMVSLKYSHKEVTLVKGAPVKSF